MEPRAAAAQCEDVNSGASCSSTAGPRCAVEPRAAAEPREAMFVTPELLVHAVHNISARQRPSSAADVTMYLQRRFPMHHRDRRLLKEVKSKLQVATQQGLFVNTGYSYRLPAECVGQSLSSGDVSAFWTHYHQVEQEHGSDSSSQCSEQTPEDRATAVRPRDSQSPASRERSRSQSAPAAAKRRCTRDPSPRAGSAKRRQTSDPSSESNKCATKSRNTKMVAANNCRRGRARYAQKCSHARSSHPKDKKKPRQRWKHRRRGGRKKSCAQVRCEPWPVCQRVVTPGPEDSIPEDGSSLSGSYVLLVLKVPQASDEDTASS